ncbi:DUF302 domain-containing protein (plasmid) [Edwardsiella tarda]|uniref:DUF302 domain-containing protein n=1 Tax=Edwardsiella tarda TaxID=636 RepID=UPI002444B1FA|nr:DUF302 domain-containing protein [Edwardsiella tarda]WGE30997.1 DUF302 domain-containing protein [Edwardsiella tarda]
MTNRRTFLISALLSTSLLAASGVTFAAENHGFVKVESHHKFAETTVALKQAVTKNQLMVMGHINQAKALSMTGLKMEGGESILVGNPQMGKKIFSMDPAAGAVLPVRMYVWIDQGKTWIGWFRPSTQLGEISPMLEKAGSMMDMKLQQVAEQASVK